MEFGPNGPPGWSLMAIFTFSRRVRWRSSIFLWGPIFLKSGPRRGARFCDIKVSIDGSNSGTPAYVEVFERYNPTGQILSMVLAEIEATTKYPLEPGQVCFGRFGLVQGVLPEGTDLTAPTTCKGMI